MTPAAAAAGLEAHQLVGRPAQLERACALQLFELGKGKPRASAALGWHRHQRSFLHQ